MKIMNIHCSIINLQPRQFGKHDIGKLNCVVFEKLRIKLENLIKSRKMNKYVISGTEKVARLHHS